MKTLNDFYTDGEYLKNNPSWDSEDAPWKAKQLFELFEKSDIEIQNIKTISEVGCGSGEVLINFANLITKKEDTKENKNIKSEVKYCGYDLSPDAIKIAEENKIKLKTNTKESNFNADNFEFKVRSIPDQKSELLICADVFEHIENPFTFLRDIKDKSDYFLFNIPLDLSVQSMMREHVILAQRKRVGHVNYYTKNLALETLKDTGYEIIIYEYAPWYKMYPSKSISTKISNMLRDIFMRINPELCVQYLGGASLVVLAK